jgi:PAS domain S-box-containing protein
MENSVTSIGSREAIQRQAADSERDRGSDAIARFDGEGGYLHLPVLPETADDEMAGRVRAASLRVSQLERELGEMRISLQLAKRDVETLKQSDTELRTAMDCAKAILEDVPPRLILDKDLRVTMANNSFYSYFQISPGKAEACPIYELGNGQWDLPVLRALLEKVLPRNSSFKDLEITREFPSLGTRTILLSGRPLEQLQKILLSIEDVSERLHSQDSMRRSESRYRGLFEAAKDGILLVDPDTRKITDCNPFMAELLDYSPKELIGKELWEIGLLKDEQASREAFSALQEDSYIRYEDLPLETKTGLRREVEFVSNLYCENGASVIQCNVRDISARKRTELALAAANDKIGRHAAELETRVAERTMRLQETIGELEMFSYTVAHDMRAPLRAMAGFAQILQEDFGNTLPPEAKSHIIHITSAAARMDMLIQDVLTYTTILHSEIKLSVVDLDILVRQVIQTYPQLHTGEVQIEIEELLPKVLGHPATISQCISNLLTNAVKFVNPGAKPRVKVRAVEHDSCIRVWVEDNGIGIEPKDHKRIFQMFERVHNEYEGTGIGLAIVRKSIERSRGKVGVESALGEGSKFWLEFKRIR